MNDTFKAVFICKALNERVVWYVSNRTEANRHYKHHLEAHKLKYHKHECTMEFVPVFQN
jgi:hypothetical protein